MKAKTDIKKLLPWLNLLKEGDIITHKRCMGSAEEHHFTGMDTSGRALCGIATHDTLILEDIEDEGYANDISPYSVTHINRVCVGAYTLIHHRERNRLRRRAKKMYGKGYLPF